MVSQPDKQIAEQRQSHASRQRDNRDVDEVYGDVDHALHRCRGLLESPDEEPDAAGQRDQSDDDTDKVHYATFLFCSINSKISL